MKRSSFVTSFFVFSIFLSLSLGCSFISNKTSEETPSLKSPTPVTTSKTTTPTPNDTKDIAGKYKTSGTNIDGKGNYNADLAITKRGEVYQFSWDSGDQTYDGVGVVIGDAVSVSFTNGISGKGCGVVLYEIYADGSLDGRAGYWGVEQSETEKATRTKGADVVGEYDVKGINAAGEQYNTKLSISKSGSGLAFSWTGTTPFQGFGIQHGNMLTAGFGGKHCSFVAYQIKSDGSLEGKWGAIGTTSFGTEKAVKK